MKMKKAIKKIVALGMGATMVGATLLGAMAYDLSDYPAPFVENGMANVEIVIGENASPADVLGAVDIATALQTSSVTEEAVTVESTGTTTVSGGKVEDDLVVGDDLTATKTYDESDVTVLSDSQVKYDGSNVNYKEKIVVTNGFFDTRTGEDQEEYGLGVVAVTDSSNSLSYRYEFDSALTFNATADDDLDIKFLGQDLTITNVASGKVTLSTASEEWVETGDTLTVTVAGEEYEVEFGGAYGSEAKITLDGQTEFLAAGDSFDEDFEDFELEVVKVVDDTSDANIDQVKLKYGSVTSKTISNGDAAESLGYGDDKTEAEWIWDISASGTALTYIGVKYNQDRTEIESELSESWEKPVLLEGEDIVFPNGFVTAQFASVNNNEGKVPFSVVAEDSKNWYNEDNDKVFSADEDVVRFDAGDEEIFKYGTETYAKIIIAKDGSKIGFEDKDGTSTNVTTTLTNFSIIVDDDTKAVGFVNVSNLSKGIVFGDIAGYDGTNYANDLTFKPDFADTKGDDAASADLKLGSSEIGQRDYDFMTHYGVEIEEPKSTLDDDFATLKLSYPKKALTWDLAVSSSKAVTTSGSEVTSEKVNPIDVGFAVLDSSNPTGNMIVVGGPCANTVARDLMEVTSENCGQGFEANKATIKFFDNEGSYAILVAGYEATETQAASRALASAKDLEGEEMSVSVTSVDEWSVSKVEATEEEDPVVNDDVEE